MRALVEDLKQKVAVVTQGGDKAARDKHTARGKMLPRERVAKLSTWDRPFSRSASLRRGACTAATCIPGPSSAASAG